MKLKINLTLGILFFIFYLGKDIEAIQPLRLYEKGYKLEKTYPLFAIPVYEKVLQINPDYKLKKITATRLYYLYKKFRKYPELLNHYALYKNILSIGNEQSNSIQQILKVYRISYAEFQEVYPIISRINSENIGSLLDTVMNSSSPSLFNFSYSYLIANKKYDELRIVMFYLPENLALPVLRIGLLVKMNDPETENVIQKFLEREDLSDKTKSDTYYLLGQYHLIQENFTSAEDSFQLSRKFGDNERALREIAKSYIAQGRISEACGLGQFPSRSFHEADHLLFLTCTKKDDLIPEMKTAIEVILSNENSKYYNALLKWHWN